MALNTILVISLCLFTGVSCNLDAEFLGQLRQNLENFQSLTSFVIDTIKFGDDLYFSGVDFNVSAPVASQEDQFLANVQQMGFASDLVAYQDKTTIMLLEYVVLGKEDYLEFISDEGVLWNLLEGVVDDRDAELVLYRKFARAMGWLRQITDALVQGNVGTAIVEIESWIFDQKLS